MKCDQSSVKLLIKQATAIFMDDQLYEIDWCDEEQFQAIAEDGTPDVFWYEDINVNEVLIYKTVLLNP